MAVNVLKICEWLEQIDNKKQYFIVPFTMNQTVTRLKDHVNFSIGQDVVDLKTMHRHTIYGFDKDYIHVYVFSSMEKFQINNLYKII